MNNNYKIGDFIFDDNTNLIVDIIDNDNYYVLFYSRNELRGMSMSRENSIILNENLKKLRIDNFFSKHVTIYNFYLKNKYIEFHKRKNKLYQRKQKLNNLIKKYE